MIIFSFSVKKLNVFTHFCGFFVCKSKDTLYSREGDIILSFFSYFSSSLGYDKKTQKFLNGIDILFVESTNDQRLIYLLQY